VVFDAERGRFVGDDGRDAAAVAAEALAEAVSHLLRLPEGRLEWRGPHRERPLGTETPHTEA
jgi:hypothetical protein